MSGTTSGTNVALTSLGTSFVSASSANQLATGSALATMQTDPISPTPTPWLSNGDTRYVFADSARGQPQTYEIKLGSTYSLNSFSSSYATNDFRSFAGPNVSTSLDGVTFTPVTGTFTAVNGTAVTTDTLTAQAPVTAQYVLYDFGASTDTFNDGVPAGSAFYNVTANATPLCFCRGTLVATPGGEVPVERIQVGDLVLTAGGVARPVRWIGDGAALANDDNRPVLIRRGAFPDGTPRRDLRVTRGHSFLFGDVLVPIGCLINGASILFDAEARTVEVFHLELDRHDILLAEGAQAESYRDIGNRDGFAFVSQAGTGGAAPPAKSVPSCRPIVMHCPIVERTRRRLAERAERLAEAVAKAASAEAGAEMPRRRVSQT